MKISFSAISTFLSCQARYAYKYRDGLRVIQPMAVFEIGSIVHHALEIILTAHALGEPLPEIDHAVREGCKALSARRKMTLDSEESAQVAAIMLAYHLPLMQLDRWETLLLNGKPGVELELDVPFAGARMLAHIDWVARSKESGKVYIIDHKTSKNRLDVQPYVYHDLQLAIYRHVYNETARENGWPVADGAMLNQMCTTPPTAPEKLKKKNKGRWLSTAKAQRTTREIFAGAVHESGEDFALYAEFLEYLDDAEARRPFRRWTPDLTDDAGHAAILKNAERAVTQMALVKSGAIEPVANRVNEWSCGRCEQRPLCDADMLGLDPRSLVLSLYSPDDDSKYVEDNATTDRSAMKLYTARVSHTGRFNTHGWTPHA